MSTGMIQAKWHPQMVTLPGVPQPLPAAVCTAKGHDGKVHKAMCMPHQYNDPVYRDALEARVVALASGMAVPGQQ